jgi:hypothetical protein
MSTSLYLPEPVYEALRKVAFEERLKINDVVLVSRQWRGERSARQAAAAERLCDHAAGEN